MDKPENILNNQIWEVALQHVNSTIANPTVMDALKAYQNYGGELALEEDKTRSDFFNFIGTKANNSTDLNEASISVEKIDNVFSEFYLVIGNKKYKYRVLGNSTIDTVIANIESGINSGTSPEQIVKDISNYSYLLSDSDGNLVVESDIIDHAESLMEYISKGVSCPEWADESTWYEACKRANVRREEAKKHFGKIFNEYRKQCESKGIKWESAKTNVEEDLESNDVGSLISDLTAGKKSVTEAVNLLIGRKPDPIAIFIDKKNEIAESIGVNLDRVILESTTDNQTNLDLVIGLLKTSGVKDFMGLAISIEESYQNNGTVLVESNRFDVKPSKQKAKALV